MAHRSAPTESSDESDHYERLPNVPRRNPRTHTEPQEERSSNWIMRTPERYPNIHITPSDHAASSIISSETLDRPPDTPLRQRRDQLMRTTHLSGDFHTNNEAPPFEDYDEDPLVNLRTRKNAEEHVGYLVRKSVLEPRVETADISKLFDQMLHNRANIEEYNDIKRHIKLSVLSHACSAFEDLPKLFEFLRFEAISITSLIYYKLQYLLLKLFFEIGMKSQTEEGCRLIEKSYKNLISEISCSKNNAIRLPVLLSIGLLYICGCVTKARSEAMKEIARLTSSLPKGNVGKLSCMVECYINFVIGLEKGDALRTLSVEDWQTSLTHAEQIKLLLGSYDRLSFQEKVILPTYLTVLLLHHHDKGHAAESILFYAKTVANGSESDDIEGTMLKSYLNMLMETVLEKRVEEIIELDAHSEDNLLMVLDLFQSEARRRYAFLGIGKDMREKCIGVASLESTILRCIEEDMRVLDIDFPKQIETLIYDDTISIKPFWKRYQCSILGKYGTCTVLIPSMDCAAEDPYDDYKENADERETKETLNELDILLSIHYRGSHENIIHMMIHQLVPRPVMFITEGKGENLLTYLLRHNKRKKTLKIDISLNFFLHCIKALQFLHDKGVVHRDIIAKSFEVHTTSNAKDPILKLSSFRIATFLWEEGEQPKTNIIDPNCDQLPTLSSAPESHLEAIFHTKSDIWQLGVLGFEIFNYGGWPFLNETDTSLDHVMVQVTINKRKPTQTKQMPDQVNKILLDALENDPNGRLDLNSIEERIIDFLQEVSKLRTQPYKIYNQMQDVWGSKNIPAMSSLQSKDPEHIERGTPKELIEFRKAKEGPYTMYDNYQDICNQQNNRRIVLVTPDDIESEFRVERVLDVQRGTLEVSEQLCPGRKDELSFLNKEALCIVSDMWPPKVGLPEGIPTLNYQCLPGMSLFDIATDALYGDHIEGYIPILHQLACLLKAFHDVRWMVNCLRSRNVYVIDDEFLSRKDDELKVFIPNIGRFARMQMQNNRLLESTILQRDPALEYWQSPEVIQNSMHSPKSDVFSYARLVSEVGGILHYSRKIRRRTNRIKRIERYSVPCGNMRKSEILPFIYSDKGPPEYDTITKRIYDEIIVRGVNSEKHHRPSMAELIDTWEDIAKKSGLRVSRPNIQLVNQQRILREAHSTPNLRNIRSSTSGNTRHSFAIQPSASDVSSARRQNDESSSYVTVRAPTGD